MIKRKHTESDSKSKRCKPLRQGSSSIVGLQPLLLVDDNNDQEESVVGSCCKYETEVQIMRDSTSHWHQFFSDGAANFRAVGWAHLDTKIDLLCNKYAWAVPDDRALRIIQHFSPIIEIGAGKGYWTKLLRQRGVDILAYDKFVYNVSKSGTRTKRCQKCHSEVFEGGPEVLLEPQVKDRALLLCYPDDRESMAIVALENFQYDTIIYIGELIYTGTAMGEPVAPFGRTSSAEFQTALSVGFHCLLVCRLQTTYPNSRDCISVWKRTKFTQRVEGSESDTKAEVIDREPIPIPIPKLAVNDVEFLSADDLAQLRMGSAASTKAAKSDVDSNSLTTGKSKKGKRSVKDISVPPEEEEGESVPVVRSKKDIAALREIALDHQYNENNDTKWANIPDDEILPIDRAAPCLLHLLH